MASFDASSQHALGISFVVEFDIEILDPSISAIRVVARGYTGEKRPDDQDGFVHEVYKGPFDISALYGALESAVWGAYYVAIDVGQGIPSGGGQTWLKLPVSADEDG